MKLAFCPSCGEKLVRISTKTANYKAVCLNCEITYKLSGDGNEGEGILFKGSSPSQMTEAMMQKSQNK